MKKIFIVLLITVVAFFYFNFCNKGDFQIIKDGESDITIIKGENRVVFEEIEKINKEYRIFAININNDKDSPLNHISAFLAITPIERARKILKADNCEAQAVSESVLMPIIIEDAELIKKMKKFAKNMKKIRHLSLRLSGKLLAEREHIYKNETINNRGNLDISKCLFLLELEQVEW